MKKTDMKTPSLLDIIQLRQGELSRLLAGCAAVRPLETLKLLDHFDLAMVTDGVACSFIWELRKRRGELQRTRTPEEQRQMAGDIALESWPIQYCQWLEAAASQEQPLEEAIRGAMLELKTLTITKATVDSLAPYAARVAESSKWGTT